MTDQTLTRSQACAAEITALLRAKESLLWIVTREEFRAENYLIEAGAAAKYIPRFWDCVQGITRFDRTPETFGTNDIDETLNTILERATTSGKVDRGLWILRDAHEWLSGPIGIRTRRQLRNLARKLPRIPNANNAQSIIILSPSSTIPDELAGHTTVVDWPYPDRAELTQIFDDAMEILPPERRNTNGARDAAIDAAIGLSSGEAESCYSKSLATLGRIEARLVASEKKKIITRERVLEWFDPIPGGMDAIGGLDALKRWAVARACAYTPAARAYKLPTPKGMLLVGISGCGKSLTAKALATAWQVPLLKLDLGALKGKFVGESEGNLRRALRVIEAIGRCIVWLDEIEKAFAGAINGGADGGVAVDQLGAILTWMQERRGAAFIIATANDVSKLPPELLRKGRFDEIFSIDTPTLDERCEIIVAALREHGRIDLVPNEIWEGGDGFIDVDDVAEATADFTGAEITALIPEAMYAAFADNQREITTSDLVAAARNVVPLTKTAAEKIAAFRDWAKSRARPASSATTSTPALAAGSRRNLDL